jgi:hypothetical protein
MRYKCGRSFCNPRYLLWLEISKYKTKFHKKIKGRISCDLLVQKQKSHLIVQNNVAIGKIKRPLYCEQCNGYGKMEGHHENYCKPLSVKWLCRKCHAIEHGKLKIKDRIHL